MGGVAATHGEVQLGLGVQKGGAGGFGPGDEGVQRGHGPVIGPVVGEVIHGLADVAELEEVKVVIFEHTGAGVKS